MADWFFEPLYPLFYELLVVDPPWEFETFSKAGAEKSPSAQYETMTDQEILDLPVSYLASFDCLLLLWATAPRLTIAIDCLQKWGFTYRSFMVWRKVTPNGKIRMGTGYRVRTTGEILLVGTIGNPKQSCVPQTIFDGVAREHSRKPEEFYGICDRLMPRARRADVFARQKRPGWHSFGNEIQKFGETSA